MPLMRPQKVLVAAVDTNQPQFWGSMASGTGRSAVAAVTSNRRSRVYRIGMVEANVLDPQGGFGPFQPAVIGAGVRFSGTGTLLTRSRRLSATQRQGKSTLGQPQGIFNQTAMRPIEGYLAPVRDRRPPTSSHFSGPTVTGVPSPPQPVLGGIGVQLVQIRPPAVQSKLGPPILATVSTPLEPIQGFLAPFTRPPAVHSRLGRPILAAVVAQVYSGPVVHLARSTRPRTLSELRPPTVVAPVLAPPVEVKLAPQKRGIPRSILRPPTVVAPVLARPIRVELAPQKRGVPRSILRPPAVVAPVLARPLALHLAYSVRGKPKYRLSPPVAVAPVLARHEILQLVQIRPPAVHSVLRPPVVVLGAVELSGPEVTLAPSKRGRAKPFLLPVPEAFQPVGQLVVHLTYSRRGKPIYRLGPMGGPAVSYRPIAVTLAPQSRRPGRWHLGPMGAPAVVYAPLAVTLAPSRRPVAKSTLSPPSPFAPQSVADTTLLVKLTYSSRGRAKSRLTQVVYGAKVYAPISTTLAPQRRGRPRSRLFGVVVAAKVFAPIAVTLAPSKRGRPIHRLGPPTVLAKVVNAPLQVHMARSGRGRPIHFLRPPTKVNAVATLLEGRVTLTRIRPRRTIHFLRPPTAVTPFVAVVYPPIKVHLAPSKRGRTMWALTLTAAELHICFGIVSCGVVESAIVTGFDFAPNAQGGDEGAEVCGTDEAATVEGASSSGSSVTGGDTRREGC